MVMANANSNDDFGHEGGKYCRQDMKDFYLKSNRDDFYFKQGFPTGKTFIFNLCDLYLKSTRDGRFRVNDEIINVNGSSLRGLSMEQVFIIIIIIIIYINITNIIIFIN